MIKWDLFSFLQTRHLKRKWPCFIALVQVNFRGSKQCFLWSIWYQKRKLAISPLTFDFAFERFPVWLASCKVACDHALSQKKDKIKNNAWSQVTCKATTETSVGLGKQIEISLSSSWQVFYNGTKCVPCWGQRASLDYVVWLWELCECTVVSTGLPT